MNAKITVASVVFVSLQFAGFSAGYAYHEPAIDLRKQCNETATISCPKQYSGKAGTVRLAFWNLPPSDRRVNVTLEASSCSTSDIYAMCFNIRKFIPPYTDGVRIYEDESVIRGLDGSISAAYDRASVAQVRTRYTRRPAVRIDHIRGPSLDTAAIDAFFDYIIVEGQSTYRNTYCSALSGFVSGDCICDKDGSTDRCSCDYSPISYGQNPAYSREYCRSSSGSGSYTLSPGAIFGIIFSVFSFLVALVRAIAYANKHSSPSSTQVMPSSLVLVTVTVSRPAVVGQPVFPSSAAPPSYDQVMGPGGATTYPAAPVQKF